MLEGLPHGDRDGSVSHYPYDHLHEHRGRSQLESIPALPTLAAFALLSARAEASRSSVGKRRRCWRSAGPRAGSRPGSRPGAGWSCAARWYLKATPRACARACAFARAAWDQRPRSSEPRDSGCPHPRPPRRRCRQPGTNQGPRVAILTCCVVPVIGGRGATVRVACSGLKVKVRGGVCAGWEWGCATYSLSVM